MPAKKSPKSPDSAAEARRTNVLLEELDSQLRLVSEGVAAIRRDVDGLKAWRTETTDNMDLIKAIIRKNTDELDRIRDDLKAFLKRLETVETRFS
jgi:hypothetical protein